MANAYASRRNTDKMIEMKHGGNSVHQFVVMKSPYFYEFLYVLVFFFIGSEGNECGIEFQITEEYTEKHALGNEIY